MKMELEFTDSFQFIKPLGTPGLVLHSNLVFCNGAFGTMFVLLIQAEN